ncbi:MAG: amidohydrolase, partial [Oscillospiraceae bacterium]|nr:amidohydrolase [Oscillospiraceae bacterium]
MKAILSYIDSLLPELTELRRDFHRHPELVWREIYTSAKIAAYLKDLGYEVLMGEAVCSREAQTGLPEPELLQQALD